MKTIRFLIFVFHLIIIFLLVGTVANSVIPPSKFPYFNLLSLGFPILLPLHIILCVFWIILRKKRAFFFLFFSVFLIFPSKRWVNYSPKKKDSANLKILTFNVHDNSIEQGKIISQFLEKQKADIIFLQESGYPDPKNSKTLLRYVSEDKNLIVIHSDFKIINEGIIMNSAPDVGKAQYADVEINGKIIRVINIYLEPFALEKAKVKPEENIDGNKHKVKYILGKLIPTFKTHQKQVDEIHHFISQSPYPVIVAGDFNAVPNSYEYYNLPKGLQDVFSEVGSGSSTSFHDYKFPIRIDYVFCSKEIVPLGYSVDRSVRISDHFPVYAEFMIK